MYRKNAWSKYKEDLSPVMNFAEDYKRYITVGKTERLVARESARLLEENGFVCIDKVKELKAGDRVYFIKHVIH